MSVHGWVPHNFAPGPHKIIPLHSEANSPMPTQRILEPTQCILEPNQTSQPVVPRNTYPTDMHLRRIKLRAMGHWARMDWGLGWSRVLGWAWVRGLCRIRRSTDARAAVSYLAAKVEQCIWIYSLASGATLWMRHAWGAWASTRKKRGWGGGALLLSMA